MAQKKISQKMLDSTGGTEPGHNRRLSPFDRNDQLQWGKLKKQMNSLESLAATWLTDAAVLKRYGYKEMANMAVQHANDLRKAASSMK